MKDFDIKKGFWEQERINTDLYKAYNILMLPLNSLTYNFDSGIDFDYFLNNNLAFKKQSFIEYEIQRLIEQGCDVVSNIVSIQDYIYNNTIYLEKLLATGEGLF